MIGIFEAAGEREGFSGGGGWGSKVRSCMLC